MNMPDMEYVACPASKCGGQWLPESKVRQLRESHEAFYCPSGHSQWFSGQSEADKLKAEIERLKKERDYWLKKYEEHVEKYRAEWRSKNALRGVITKMRKAG